MRIAIVGCGAVGARAARQLVSSTGIDRVVLRDTRADWLESLGASLGPAVELEVPPYGEDLPAVDVVIVATPAGTHAPIARAAVARGIDVVSVSDDVDDV